MRSRGRQILFAKCRQTVIDTVSMGFALLRLLFSLLLLLINPLFDFFAPSKPSPSTPPPSAVAVFHAQATSDAFSDEEQDCTVSTMSHESDLAVPLLRDSDLGVDSDSLDPDSSRTRSDTPPTRTPHRLVVILTSTSYRLLFPGTRCWRERQVPPPQASGCFCIETDLDILSISFLVNFHPFYPGKRLIFTDMDMEDESPKPEPSRDNKDARPSSDSDDSDSEFAVKPQCLAARLAFDAFSDDDF